MAAYGLPDGKQTLQWNDPEYLRAYVSGTLGKNANPGDVGNFGSPETGGWVLDAQGKPIPVPKNARYQPTDDGRGRWVVDDGSGGFSATYDVPSQEELTQAASGSVTQDQMMGFLQSFGSGQPGAGFVGDSGLAGAQKPYEPTQNPDGTITTNKFRADNSTIFGLDPQFAQVLGTMGGLAGGFGALNGAFGAAAGAGTGMEGAMIEGGFTGGGGLAGTTGVGTLGGTQGGGMFDWLNELLGSGVGDEAGFQAGSLLDGASGIDPTGIASSFAGDVLGSGPMLPNGTPLDLALSNAGISSSVIRSLIGSAGNALGGSAGGSNGQGILGQFSNDPLGSAFNMTPFLLALAQSQSQKSDIQPYLDQINQAGSSLNPQAYAKSLTDPFDLQTSAARGELQQSLSNRGVAGSSFGNMDLGNFDYLRGLGRADVQNRGLMTGAGLQTQNAQAGAGLVNQRNLGSNALIGAGLNATGSLFKPQTNPFNLAALLGLGG